MNDVGGTVGNGVSEDSVLVSASAEVLSSLVPSVSVDGSAVVDDSVEVSEGVGLNDTNDMKSACSTIFSFTKLITD